MLAVAISAAMTAVAGVFFAFYYNNLFPEQAFDISRSIEIILGPISAASVRCSVPSSAQPCSPPLRRHH